MKTHIYWIGGDTIINAPYPEALATFARVHPALIVTDCRAA